MANKKLSLGVQRDGGKTSKADAAKETGEVKVGVAPAEKPTEATAGKRKIARPKKRGLSMMEAARQVLAERAEPMTCQDLVEAMDAKGLWTSPGGKTPANTLYSSFLRLIRRDGKSAGFKKGRGKFTLNPSASA